MKECLVIALILTLTGTVVGQSSSARSAFDSPRVDSTRTTPRFDSQPSRSAVDDKQGPMVVDLNDALLDQMINDQQELEATVVSKDKVNGIVIRFGGKNDAKPAVTDVPTALRPSLESGDGVLRFSLDREGIELLKSSGLQYRYRPSEVADYDTVVLSFKNDDLSSQSVLKQPKRDLFAKQSSVTNPTESSNRFGSSSTRDFGQSTTSNDEQRFLALKREQDRELAARELADRQRMMNRTPSFDDNRSFSQTTNDRGDSSDRLHQFQLTDDQIDKMATSVQQIRDNNERLRRRNEASEREARLANADRLRLLQQLRDQNSLDQVSVAKRRALDPETYNATFERRPLSPATDRFALAETNSRSVDRFSPNRAATDQYQYTTDQYSEDRFNADRYNADRSNLNRSSIYETNRRDVQAELADRFTHDQLESERLRNERLALENEKLRFQQQLAAQNQFTPTTNAVTRTPIDTNQRPLRMRDFGASIPGTRQPPENRVASLNTPGHTPVGDTVFTSSSVDHILKQYNGNNFSEVASRVQQEVAGAAAAKLRTDKYNGFFLFLFITSFALNLYLAWLAQTFYGRYGELADELRDTFTSTT